MVPIFLKATNFLSFKHFYYKFENRAYAIQGENLTDDGQKSNGSGKSGFNEALEFSLFGNTSRDALLKTMTRRGETHAEVQLCMYCPIRNKNLGIFRSIVKGSGKLELYLSTGKEVSVCDENKVDFSTVDDGNKFIIEWLDMSKSDLQNYYILNGEKYLSFYKATNKEKIALISRISNTQIIDGTDTLVSEEIDTELGNLRTLEDKTIVLNTKRDTYKEQLEKEGERDFDEELRLKLVGVDENIEAKKNSIEFKKGRLKELDKSIKERQDSLKITKKKLQVELTKLKTFKSNQKDYSKISSDLAEKRSVNAKEGKEMVTLKKEFNEAISEINNSLAGIITCPKCNHRFVLDEDVDISEAEDRREELKSGLETIGEQINQFKDIVNGIDEDIEKVDSSKLADKKVIRTFNNLISDIESNVESTESRIKTLKDSKVNVQSTIDSYREYIKELEKSKVEIKEVGIDNKDIVNTLTTKITFIDTDILENERAIKTKEDEIATLKEWVFNFKQFYAYLANNSLKVIEGHCNKYLRSLKSDLEIKWEGYKVLGNGNLKEKITPYVIRGGEILDFGGFSKGERGRMEYALILAQQEIINNSNKWGGLQLLTSDEVDAGLDSYGLGLLLKSLTSIGKPILITTHITDDLGCNTIIVRKEFNESKLIINE